MEAVWSVRVYYEDTDAGGVVYHSQYLNFYERARTEWLRELGFEQDQLKEQLAIIFAVRKIEIDYLLPAYFNQQLEVVTKIQKMTSSTITFQQTIQTIDGILLNQAEVLVVCIDSHKLKPKRIPENIKSRLPK